jgi:hypothetical protein
LMVEVKIHQKIPEVVVMDYSALEMRLEHEMWVSVSVFAELLTLVSVERVREVLYVLSLDSRLLICLSVAWVVTG